MGSIQKMLSPAHAKPAHEHTAHSPAGIPSNIMAAFAAERSKIKNGNEGPQQGNKDTAPTLHSAQREPEGAGSSRSEVAKLKEEVGVLKRKMALLEGAGERRGFHSEGRPDGQSTKCIFLTAQALR